MDGDSGIVMEDVCRDGMLNLGGRLVLMLMRGGVLVGGMVVVVVDVIVMVDVGVTTPPHQCDKRIKFKSEKVLGANSYVSGSYSGKTETGVFLQ